MFTRILIIEIIGCSCNRVNDFSNNKPIEEYSNILGYSNTETEQGKDANLGLGCGNYSYQNLM